MKNKILLSILIALSSIQLSAQTRTITGTVKDDSGVPMASVSVLVKDTYQGTLTDEVGQYSIDVEAGEVLEFSFLGYARKQVPVSDQRVINVVLKEGINLQQVAVVGSRNVLRMTTETAVPMDILDINEIAASAPQVTLSQILNYVAPSFSSNTQTISDGTDHVDPAQLRGLGPDQVLVLINGKRRHTSSLVNINGTVGRGSVGTDLNAIPASAIQRIEVLRDGAAAQYGSDAIAGVINIVLKEQVNELTFSYTSGANVTSESEVIDGQTNTLQMGYGVPLGKQGGFLRITGEANMREPIDRTGDFEGQIFNRYNSVERLALADGLDLSQLSEEDLAYYAEQLGFDPRTQEVEFTYTALQSFLNDDVTEEELAARGLTRRDFNIRTGQSKLREGKGFLNLSVPIKDKAEIYAFGGMSYRDGNSGGFYRLPYQERTYTPIYFNGFIPEINSTIIDQSVAAGVKGIFKGWLVDFSNTWGRNSFDYLITNTLNASMESRSPTSFQAGSHAFMQNTTNFDVSRFWKGWLSGVNFAWGLEHRLENFQVHAGEEASWGLYNTNGDLVTGVPDEDLVVTDYFRRTRPGGAQVFPGFRPKNELNRSRNSIAAYTDLEVDITPKWLFDVALRFENYSDFGSTLNYKLATRYKLSDRFVARAAASTGFRAPSLHQLYFNRVSTQFIGGEPYDIGTYSNDSEIASLLGIPQLKQEQSTNYSGGLSARIAEWGLTASVDLFQVTILDRITYTGSFSATDDAADDELRSLLDQVGASSATFFANTIDVRAQGVDFVLSQQSKIGKGRLNTNLSLTFSETRRIGDIHASAQLANKLTTYFNEFDRVLLETASPRTKMHLSVYYNWKRLNVFVRESYFGEVVHASRVVADQQVLSPKWLTDVSVGFSFLKGVILSVGANNVFDVYPDRILPTNADYSSGRFPYSRRSTQFGFAGRYVFVRVGYGL